MSSNSPPKSRFDHHYVIRLPKIVDDNCVSTRKDLIWSDCCGQGRTLSVPEEVLIPEIATWMEDLNFFVSELPMDLYRALDNYRESRRGELVKGGMDKDVFLAEFLLGKGLSEPFKFLKR